jgi:hypothetical protein
VNQIRVPQALLGGILICGRFAAQNVFYSYDLDVDLTTGGAQVADFRVLIRTAERQT